MFKWYKDGMPKIAKIYGENIYPDQTEAALRAIARYDLIIGGVEFGDTAAQAQKTADNIARVREMNDRAIVLTYIGGACENRLDNPFFSADCFLRTPEGEFISSWPGSHLLNLSRPETVDSLVRLIASRFDGRRAVDGIYIDCMGGAFDLWAAELATGKKVRFDADGDGRPDDIEALNRAWREGKLSLLRKLREIYGGAPYILVNGGTDDAYARPYADGNIFEDTVDALTLPDTMKRLTPEDILRKCALWKEGCGGHRNCTYLSNTPLIDCDYNIASTGAPDENVRLLTAGYDSRQYLRFGLAFTLLTDVHYSYQMHTRCLGQYWWYPEFDTPLGAPLGDAYVAQDGTHRREYENAVVVCNRTLHDVKPHFCERLRDIGSGWTGADFWIPAKDGRILLRVGN